MDNKIQIIHDPDEVYILSITAESQFLAVIRQLGFDLLPETRKKWWPLNY